MVLHIKLNKSHKGCSFILQLIIPDFKVNSVGHSLKKISYLDVSIPTLYLKPENNIKISNVR